MSHKEAAMRNEDICREYDVHLAIMSLQSVLRLYGDDFKPVTRMSLEYSLTKLKEELA